MKIKLSLRYYSKLFVIFILKFFAEAGSIMSTLQTYHKLCPA